MIRDVLYNSKVLDGLFRESDFAFLNEADNEIAELNECLSVQKITREHIINFISNLEGKQGPTYASAVEEARSVFDLVNQNIKNIYTLQDQFQQLEQMIINLIVDLENNNSSEKSIFEVKLKINSYSALYKDIKNSILSNNTKIGTFLTKFDIKIENPIADREVVVNLNNYKHDDEILDTVTDNPVLIISETQAKVFLPYTRDEILSFMKKYPNEYSSAKDVVEQEFVMPISLYSKHPKLARFREGYSLIRDREMKSIMDAFKFALDLMFKYELNPAIIAACKSEKQLQDYITCLENNTLDNFKYFTIKFEVLPFATKSKSKLS